jgi:hypothetical protein
MFRFRLGSIFVAAAGILITTGGCAESPSAPTAAGAGLELLSVPVGPMTCEADSEVIGPEGGVVELGGSRLVFPAGAVSEPTEIGMAADPQYQGVRLSPHGLQFPAGAQPVLELRASGVAGERAALQVVYVNDTNAVLEVLETSQQGNRVSAHLEHFSGYLIASGRSSEP